MPVLCRDCDYTYLDETDSCAGCGSFRLVCHADLFEFSFAHIDCDAFFAAIEKRDNPALRDKPVIVGGGKRGVVATCCYMARLYGVRSAMPMFKALRLCPEAVVIKPRFAVYSQASAHIRSLLQALSPHVQMVSIDEGYIDLSGTSSLHGMSPAACLTRLARKVETDLGITISIGLSTNRFLAKTASELDKPRGFSVLSPQEAPILLAPRPVRFLHGVGPQMAARLEQAGFRTIGDLQAAPLELLQSHYGETGLWLHQRAFGIDTRPLIETSERKSISAERTFAEDIRDLEALTDQLWHVCEETARRAKRHGLDGASLSLKLKTSTFRTLARSSALPQPTHLAQSLFRTARPLLQRVITGKEAYRLIGISLTQLSPTCGDVPDLIDESVAKRAAAERASDIARERFGAEAVMTARAVRLLQAQRP